MHHRPGYGRGISRRAIANCFKPEPAGTSAAGREVIRMGRDLFIKGCAVIFRSMDDVNKYEAQQAAVKAARADHDRRMLTDANYRNEANAASRCYPSNWTGD